MSRWWNCCCVHRPVQSPHAASYLSSPIILTSPRRPASSTGGRQQLLLPPTNLHSACRRRLFYNPSAGSGCTNRSGSNKSISSSSRCTGHVRPASKLAVSSTGLALCSPGSGGFRRTRTRRSTTSSRMDVIRRKYPNHTEMAYREAVAKLKYLLAESYAPKMSHSNAMLSGKRYYRDDQQQQDEYLDDGTGADAQSLTSLVPATDGPASKRADQSAVMTLQPVRGGAKYNSYPSTRSHAVVPAPAELTSFIERQEEYIEQLERESHCCREELKNLVEKVKEVIAENEALQDKSGASNNKSSSLQVKSILLDGGGSYATSSSCLDDQFTKRDDFSPKLTSSTSGRLGQQLEGPSIVFESRISELEAQLTQTRLELRKAREENQRNLGRLAERGGDDAQIHLELERALRERRELDSRADELQRELARIRAHEVEVEQRSRRALELAQQAEIDKSQAELEVKRLRDELERRQDKLREALHETNRRCIEEKKLAERKFSQQMEQLSADMASHWEAASKSHLESEKQRWDIAELKKQLIQKAALVDELKADFFNKTAKVQEELGQVLAEKDAALEELSAAQLRAERSERQAKQEQARMQGELNSYKGRLERADADLVHARRENLRLTEEIAALEKEINMSKLMGETRVGAGQPLKAVVDKPASKNGDKDKELASLILDLESKQAKTVATLEDSLSKQASLVTRLTAECQSLTQRLEANDQKHKKEMADLQSNIKYLSNKMKESLEIEDCTTEEHHKHSRPSNVFSKEKTPPSGLYSIEEDDGDGVDDNYDDDRDDANDPGDNDQDLDQASELDLRQQHQFSAPTTLEDTSKDVISNDDDDPYAIHSDDVALEDENIPLDYVAQPEAYGDEYAVNQQHYDPQQYEQYADYDPAQYPDYYAQADYDQQQQQQVAGQQEQHYGVDGYDPDGSASATTYDEQSYEAAAAYSAANDK
ncbi:serologically defined colon cancer antigen 8 homolog isoform X1 [Trichogramma pretiosum]|uniref:serologically defined colon cancer antigen 8 homolog isoform X1 n=2 Tax=Trichogramma pretiosum TaxID=7493 RepID=UPI000C718BFC|nr:serologically defined colon cancer antigen 8 homolog isoform X1 [Trichogramma pretiosum]